MQMEAKDSKETVRAFSSKITKKNRPRKIRVDKWTEFAGEFKNFCNIQGIQVYSTMSENKADFAERTIRSKKNILYRYMEDYGYQYIPKLPQFLTTWNSRKYCSVELKPKDVQNSDFLSILCSKPLRDHRPPKFECGDRVRILNYDLPFGKGYK